MRVTRRLSVLVAVIVVVAAVETAQAQSKDMDNPTALTSNVLKGDFAEAGARYYSLMAGPGVVTATIVMETTGSFALLVSANVQLLLPNVGKPLCTATVNGNSGPTDSKACTTTLSTEQRLILRVAVGSSCKSCTYRVHIDGMRGAGAAPSTPPGTQSSPPVTTQPCTPAVGSNFRLMVIRLKDGTTTQIDLTKVADITYK